MSTMRGDSDLDFGGHLRVLVRHKWLIGAIAVIAAVAALVVSSLQTPIYSARSQLLLRQQSSEALFDPTRVVVPNADRILQNEIRVLQSEPIRNLVREKVGAPVRASASASDDTDVITVRVTSANPQLAAAAANAFAETYIRYRRDQSANDLVEASKTIQVKVDEIRAQPSSTSQQTTLAELESIQQKLLLDAELTAGGAHIVERATVPTSPISPKTKRTIALATVLGAIVAVGLAFFLDFLDDSVKTKEEFEKATNGLPILGLIPLVQGWKAKAAPQIVSVVAPNSPAAEAYRTLKTAVQFLSLDKSVQVIHVTSPRAQDGKTATISNLAVALARAGREVVVVDCDLRRPRLHEFFGVDNDIGFTSVLLGEQPLSAALQKASTVDRVLVLPSGPLPPNPAELLSSRRASLLLESLKAAGRFVLIDSPPILPVPDALELAPHVDATLLVCRSGGTTVKEVARAYELLRQVDAPVVGGILNSVKSEGRSGDYYYYRQYGSPPTANGHAGVGNGHGSKDQAAKEGRKGTSKGRVPGRRGK